MFTYGAYRAMSAPVASKHELLARLRARRREIIALDVRALGVFGSFARNDQDNESDIDFLVEFAPDHKTFAKFMQLAFLLEDALQRRVELITPESLKPYMRDQIMDEVEYVPLDEDLSPTYSG